MFFEKTDHIYRLRVRLAPNSSSCRADGTIIGPNEEEYLKIAIVAVPEKGKANKELIAWLSKKLGLSKSAIQITSGETNHWKKLSIEADDSLAPLLENLAKENR